MAKMANRAEIAQFFERIFLAFIVFFSYLFRLIFLEITETSPVALRQTVRPYRVNSP